MDNQKSSDGLTILSMAQDRGRLEHLKAVLESSDHPPFQMLAAGSLAEGLRVIAAFRPDIILLYFSLPDNQASEAFTRTHQASGDIPIIILDDSEEPSQGLEYTRQGAWNYFNPKSIHAENLWAAIIAASAGHQRERVLHKSMVKFRTIIDTLEDAYYETDLEGRLTYVNATLCEHLQRPREKLIGRHRKDFAAPQTIPKLEKVLKEVYVTGATDQIVEDELLRPDGSVIHAELTITLQRDSNGIPVRYSYISRDVTAKKETEKALALNEKKYRDILASIEENYFETDLKGRILYCNDALVKHLGYSRKELQELDRHHLLDAENTEKVFQAYHHVYQTGEPILDLQHEIIDKKGERRHIETSVSLITDTNGQPIGFRGLGRDITKRKHAEEELALAKARAEEATQAKSNFLANMSHEIRTPLNAIFGMYNLLLTTELTAEQADFIATGKRSAEGLLAVIDDIMDFSKIESGQLDIESINFDLHQAIHEITALPAMQAHAKGLEFFYQIAPDVPALINGDPGRMRQIIMNLSTNAIKFTQSGEVFLSIKLVEDKSDSVKLRFTVKDTGIGISKSDQSRLFQSFQQVDASTTREYGGTGLGLAISKRLTEMMGGEMGVKSDTNQGAAFWFTSIFKKQVVHAEQKHGIPPYMKAKRILIADNNATNLHIIDGYLRQWGCDCDQATSGSMALTLLKAVARTNAPYDLVISNIYLADMDAVELAKRIKADSSLAGTLLVVLTPQGGMRGDAAQMKKIGFSAYLAKPVGFFQLRECLVRVINEEKKEFAEATTPSVDTRRPDSPILQQKGRILIAEDNPVNQKLAEHMLTKAGFSVKTVSNGLLAVKALQKKDYDLVLMDIQMPDMDGLEATRVIRDPNSKVRNHHVPIIAVTAHAMKGDREMFLKAGMNAYVSKPIQPEILFKAIENVSKDLSA